MTRNPWSRGLRGLISASLLIRATTAMAADPTKQECIVASETAQDLRHAGKLGEARVRGAVCTAVSCPGPVREDCAQLVVEVDLAMPTLVFEVKDGAGNDVTNVRVVMDGKPLIDELGGTPTAVDPGEHEFVFEADGLPSVEKTLVLREGDKNRQERVVLGVALVAHAPNPETTTARSANTDGRGQRTLGLVFGGVGVAGVAFGGILGLVASSAWSSSKSECATATNCLNHSQAVSDHDAATSAGTLSTIGFLAGGALLATGVAVFFLAPTKRESSRTTHLELAPQVGRQGGGLTLRGPF